MARAITGKATGNHPKTVVSPACIAVWLKSLDL
jgi:hypothetical protein